MFIYSNCDCVDKNQEKKKKKQGNKTPPPKAMGLVSFFFVRSNRKYNINY